MISIVVSLSIKPRKMLTEQVIGGGVLSSNADVIRELVQDVESDVLRVESLGNTLV